MEIDFIEVKANAKSLRQRGRVQGVGVNDAWYRTNRKLDGKSLSCPYYVRWVGMLTRSYSSKYKEEYPTYKDVTVCEEWRRFSVFKGWMEEQDWQGKALDKDIIKPGNRQYSPETCCFIPASLNSLLTDSAANRGDCPRGVSLNKLEGKYAAYCIVDGIKRHLGGFGTKGEASLAYRKFKANLVSEAALEQEDERVKHGLMLHAGIILRGES